MRVKRDHLVEIARFKAGELRIDQISDHALTLLAYVDDVGQITHVEHADGLVHTIDRSSADYLAGVRAGQAAATRRAVSLEEEPKTKAREPGW